MSLENNYLKKNKFYNCMKVCVISGRYPQTKFDSVVNHKLYADKFGYTYVHCNWPTTEQNPYYNKICYLLTYIDAYDYLVWIDDDAFFFDFNVNIMDFLPNEDTFISLCKSPNHKTLKTYFSSGQFILKSSELSKSFLQEVLKQNLLEIKNWWTPELGYFSNGDQDAMVYLLLTDDRFKHRAKLFDYKSFNSRPENLFNEDKHDVFLLHFTGKPEIKWSNYMKVQNQLNLNSFLVPNNMLADYALVDGKSKKDTKKLTFKRIIKWLFR